MRTESSNVESNARLPRKRGGIIVSERPVLARRYPAAGLRAIAVADEDGPVTDAAQDDELADDPASFEWEAAARSFLEETGFNDDRTDAFKMAVCCDLTLIAGGSGSLDLASNVLTYPTHVGPQSQQGVVAHEIGHWVIDWSDMQQSEEAADYIGSALLLPRNLLARELRETDWDLAALCKRHPNVLAETIALRVPEVRSALVTLFEVDWLRDRIEQRVRVLSPWEDDIAPQLTSVEYELAVDAAARGKAQRGDGIAAWPLRQATECAASQVVVVVDGDALESLPKMRRQYDNDHASLRDRCTRRRVKHN